MVDTIVIILNWNNAGDTIACLDSIGALAGIKIAIVDNHSTDNSLQQISDHLQKKGIETVPIEAQQPSFKLPDEKVFIVRSPVNSGFAAGNNLVLRQAMHWLGIKYAWLLNNDAIANETTLKALQSKIEETEDTAFAGSVVLDYYNRDLVQCCGVKYYKWLGISKLLLKNREWSSVKPAEIPYQQVDFQMGASILVKLSALKKTGLMDERFFLYFEEQDWQYTAREMGFKNVLAPDSIVYHKGSTSTNNKKHLFFYYYNKSAIIFARRHSSLITLIIAAPMLTGILLVRTRLYYKSVFWGLKGIIEGWSQR